LAPIERLFAQWERLADGTIVWRESPRDAFKSIHDWKLWERYRGKPVDETPRRTAIRDVRPRPHVQRCHAPFLQRLLRRPSGQVGTLLLLHRAAFLALGGPSYR
jgi:hypothetical protein